MLGNRLRPCTKAAHVLGRTSWHCGSLGCLAQRGEPFILLLGRLCMGSLYLVAGINHWRELTRLTHFMTGLPGGVDAWAMLTATIEVASGLALVLGFLTREFALLLVLFNLSAAVIGHPYWSIIGDPQRALGPIHRLLEGHRFGRRRALPPCARRGPSEPRPKAMNGPRNADRGRGIANIRARGATVCPVMARVPVRPLPTLVPHVAALIRARGHPPKSRNTMSGALMLWRDGRRRPAHSSVTGRGRSP